MTMKRLPIVKSASTKPGRPSTATPVSYTHLDVYKRQIQCKADAGMAQNLGECFDIHSLLNRPCSEGMTKRVKREVRKPGRFQDPDIVIPEMCIRDRSDGTRRRPMRAVGRYAGHPWWWRRSLRRSGRGLRQRKQRVCLSGIFLLDCLFFPPAGVRSADAHL